MPKIENIFTFHPTDLALVVDDDAASVVAQDVDLVGEVTIGPTATALISYTLFRNTHNQQIALSIHPVQSSRWDRSSLDQVVS
ncbi:hypothetical protein PSHT_02605 [Puccinia striiformis]|uniref:Uncharacterized protein n=1 Tax=Puccinia striiformis TaxID=27350 RepID=A0A2S4WHK8_9BASI|nr:hypothetical protein PSHT_02605 [Puccinia striiformis]